MESAFKVVEACIDRVIKSLTFKKTTQREYHVKLKNSSYRITINP